MDSHKELAELMNRVMHRLKAGMQERIRNLDEPQVGPQCNMVLMTIAGSGPMENARLVELLSRDKSQVTRMIAELEKAGLIRREPHPDDGRARLLSLTDAGMARAEWLSRAMEDVLAEILSPLAPAEQAQLTALMRKL